jgi:hypothetical protein
MSARVPSLHDTSETNSIRLKMYLLNNKANYRYRLYFQKYCDFRQNDTSAALGHSRTRKIQEFDSQLFERCSHGFSRLRFDQ